MRADPGAPADTTMMRIVHDAFRRDLERARTVLGRSPAPDARQVTAVAEQLRWMTTVLEAHHRSEDLGLYPLVRERDPGAAALLDDMARDHELVAAAIDEVARATAPAGGAVDPVRLDAALVRLAGLLLPHLRREEDEAMPVVTRTVTAAEWDAIEQEHNLAGKRTSQLAREGHWLIDEATADDRARVLGLVGPVPRFVMLHGFGPSYRRRRDAAWRPRRRVQRAGSTSVVVDAPVDAVWDVVRDPTRVGEWSHECIASRWVGGACDARPGARFRGRNRQGVFRWGRLCEIVSAEPYELAWRTVPTRLYGDSTLWAIRLDTDGSRTTIEQRFEVVRGTWLEPVYARLLPAHRDRTRALQDDLRRIGALAAHADTPFVSPAGSGAAAVR